MWTKIQKLIAGLVMALLAGCTTDNLTPPQVFSNEWAGRKSPQPQQESKPIVLMGEKDNPSAVVFEDESGRPRLGIGGEALSAGVGNKQVDMRYQVPLGEKPKRLPGAEPPPDQH